MPLGNDLLIVALTAREHSRLLYYVLMATAGSLLGCFIMDIVSRKGGEEGLERTLPSRRADYIKQKVKKNAGWALAAACLMPPPFPFTAFVAASAAFQYPRKKLLSIIAICRGIRFMIDGLLAILFGERIIQLAKTPAVQYSIIGLIVISIVGSSYSIYSWIKRSKKAA